MKKVISKLLLLIVCLSVASVIKAADRPTIEVDFRTTVPTSYPVGISAENSLLYGDDAIKGVAFFGTETSYNSAQHGLNCNSFTIEVDGPVRIDLGGCNYGADFSINGKNGFKSTIKTASCYDGTNPCIGYYDGEGTVLTISGGKYLPYLKVTPINVEDIPNNCTITYSKGTSGAEGSVLAASTIKIGSSIKIPNNHTLFIEGKTLTAWTDGTNQYTIGNEYSFSEDVTLTPIFSDNTISFATRESEASITYNFQTAVEAALVSYQSSIGFYVSRMTIGDQSIDYKITIDATSGNFNNSNGNWAQVNAGTKIALPASKNSTYKILCYQEPSTTTIAGTTDYEVTGSAGAYYINYTYTGKDNEIELAISNDLGYIRSIEVNIAAPITAETQNASTWDGKIDVWDFGCSDFDAALYNPYITVDIINSWYYDEETNSYIDAAGNTITTMGGCNACLPSWTIGDLSWVTNKKNDRLRTNKEGVICYDSKTLSSYTGYIYCNGSGSTTQYLKINCIAGDKIEFILGSNNGGAATYSFQTSDGIVVSEQAIAANGDRLTFYAPSNGEYRLFCLDEKLCCARVLRTHAGAAQVAGKLVVTDANDALINDANAIKNIVNGYSVVYTNTTTGAIKEAELNDDGSYNMLNLLSGFDYSLSFTNNNYIVKTNNVITIPAKGEDGATNVAITGFNSNVWPVEKYKVTGEILGLDEANLTKLKLTFIPTSERIYIPETELNNSTYSLYLEPNIKYIITAEGVNDYNLANNEITIEKGDSEFSLNFSKKPTYKVSINGNGPSVTDMSIGEYEFTNNEDGYIYKFSGNDNISLRDGTYNVAAYVKSQWAQQKTSNLVVEGSDTCKTINYDAVSNWNFADATFTKYGNTSPYRGLEYTNGQVNKTYLLMNANGELRIPYNTNCKIIAKACYEYHFTCNDKTIDEKTGSTSKIDQFSWVVSTDKADTLVIRTIAGESGSATYFTSIDIIPIIDYRSVLYVGKDKEFRTINEALDIIPNMNRENTDTVTIMIDPGNYEEMLVISEPCVRLRNASATPDTKLADKGVNISKNAVRITSYYGHGYNYYSMNENCKWDATILQVSKENSTATFTNPGSGTTRGSYWNATVVVNADGFEAYDIIFENSYNQYISKKESEDILVLADGNKGQRPTDYGNTSVQEKNKVERAAAIAINGDRAILYRCRVIGRQDSFYGSVNKRCVAFKCNLMGACDYIFGGMILTAYQCKLSLNTSEDKNDVAYITAPQQSSGRGYLMYECTVTSAQVGYETASQYLSKPGYFGRPWSGSTSETVYYNTTIETTNNPSYDGQSLITAEAWNSSLGGIAPTFEFGTTELSGINNSANRASWSTILTSPILTDGTEITTLNFTKGSDNWDPINYLKSIDINHSEDIYPTLENAIADIDIAKGNIIAIEYYNINGQRITQPTTGINVVRFIYNNGKSKTEKYLMK